MTKIARNIAMGLAISLLSLGCASRSMPEEFPTGSPAAPTTEAGPAWAPQELDAGRHDGAVHDPVAPDPAAHDHEGHDHANPNSTTSPKTTKPSAVPPVAPELGTEEATSPLYTCPMHPEVSAQEPGKCPKCGMTMKEKK